MAAIREFLIIVLGVLTALAVDAGWGVWQDRVEEREYLAVLADDFAVNRERLETAIRRFGEMHLAAARLLSSVQGVAPLPTDSIPLVVDQMGGQYRFEPQRASLDDLTSTGGLRLLRNQDLRRELSAFAGFVDQLQARAESFNQQWDVGVAIEDIERLELSDFWIGEAGALPPADWASIVSTRRFRNLATRRAGLARALVRDHEDMLEIVQRVESQLSTQRGR